MSAYCLSMFLIILGISIALGALFNISIPVLRLTFACLLVYWGISLLFSPASPKKSGACSSRYGIKNIEFVTVFGNQDIDISADQDDAKSCREILYVGSSGTIKINRALPTRIVVKNIASKVIIPKQAYTRVAGVADASPLTSVFVTENYTTGSTPLTIELVAVFSSVEIVAE